MSDLDELKKSKEGAREAIKWFESEFKKGNRFMRIQRDNESVQLPLLKVPSKMGEFLKVERFWKKFHNFIFSDNETSVFMKIVQFANYIVSNNSSEEGSDFPVLTLLTGENLDDRKKQQQAANSSINHVGILQSIPVKYEQIVRFYSKSKKKWGSSSVVGINFWMKNSTV